MAYVTSNTFSIRVNKTEVAQTSLNTQVIIYKGANQLSAVSGTPGTNEYKVSITGTTNCSARLENDHKTITLTSVSSNNGQINISINVENAKTYTKTISVANITATSAIKNVSSRVQTVEQKLTKDGITNIVGDYYTTKTQFDNLSIGGRNLAQKTSSDYSPSHSNFSGASNETVNIGYVLTDGLSVGDTLTVRLVYKYTDIVPADGQTATCRIQGSGDVTSWGNGKFKSSSKKTISGSGEFIFNYNFTITADHLKNSRWRTQLKHDYVQSGSITWKMFKVEKGNKATDWTPAPEDIDGQITTIEDNVSKIEQKADSITSTVSKVAKGGSNLLLNTRWEGAVPGEGKCPEWTFNSGIHVYGNQGKKGYDKENTIYLGNSSTTAYLMYQRVPLSRIPRNKAMVVSCDINIENNVKGFQIGVDFYNNDTWVHGLNFFDETKYTKANNYNCKFTTPDLKYTHALFFIQHKGSNNGDSGYLVIVGNLMLELGTEKTIWQPSYHELVNKSMVTQTASEVRYEFQQGGGFPNLLYNSSPGYNNDTGWGYWQASKYTGDTNYSELGFYIPDGYNEGCLTSPEVSVTGGKTYSFTISMFVEQNCTRPGIGLRIRYTDGSLAYPTGVSTDSIVKWNGSNAKWWKYTFSYTMPDNADYVRLEIAQGARGANSGYVIRIRNVMIIEGEGIYPERWYPNGNEIQSNITTIDINGVNVRHSDGARTNLNATALNFYNSSNNLYAQVQGGMYKFWNGSQYIGYMGHTAWADTNDQERVIVLASEYGCSTSLSSRKTSTGKYQTWVATFGKDTQVNDTTFHQGCTLTSPHLSGVFKLYGTSAMRDAYPAQIYHATDGQLAMFGDNKVAIGVMNGTELRTGIMITEDGGASNKNHMDFYGSVNMNGYSITNGNIAKTVDATSAQSYALRTMSDEQSYSDPNVKTITDIYPVQSPTEGDIRWSDRQTYHTSEVEEGIYECYIEIPWWIAQNLENDYHVNITCTNGFFQYYVSERDPYYFIVRSDKDSMGFTFEIVGKLLDNNTTAKNASIASDQYGTSASEAPDIIPEFDIIDIEPPVGENPTYTYKNDIQDELNENEK